MNKGSSQDDVIIHAYRLREADYYRPLFLCIKRFALCMERKRNVQKHCKKKVDLIYLPWL